MITQLFTVVVYNTKDDNKFMVRSDNIFEYLCDRQSAFFLWWTAKQSGIHADVTQNGTPIDFSKGIFG